MSIQAVQYQTISKDNLVKSNNSPINVIPPADKKDEVSFSSKQNSQKSIKERLRENWKTEKYWLLIDVLAILGGIGLFGGATKLMKKK